MGCDIHIAVEQKTEKGWVCINTMNHYHRLVKNAGDWDWLSPVARTRNYERFAALAGVRGDGPEPKGAPDDVSETTAFLINEHGSDGHSHSWLELSDALKVFMETEGRKFDDKSSAASCPCRYYFGVNEYRLSKDDFRIVFWFDN